MSATRGCCALKFLHALKNDLVLLTHASAGTEVLQHFFTMNVQK